MSKQLLQHSIFYGVLFPPEIANTSEQGDFNLLRCVAFEPTEQLIIKGAPLVVFDLETTGLNPHHDRIIEIGAQKFVNGELVGEFSTLIACPYPLSQVITQITGITDEMLVGQPPVEQVLEEFLSFMQGCILVAHNAIFDIGFIKASLKRMGVELAWPTFCTLKLARQLLPELGRNNLDTLADHFGLEFEARHRSIGDVKVTAAVLAELLAHEGKHLTTWQDFAPFTV
jgi:DNA polymerase III epsilon subunit family exonuclease